MASPRPAKRGRGRPPAAAGAREVQVQIRLTDDEHALVTGAAERAGLPLSTWLRVLAVRTARA